MKTNLKNNWRKPQPTLKMFRFGNEGSGAAGYAAKRIAQGETVSFDCWKVIKDESGFLSKKREFLKTVYIGLYKLKDEETGRNISLRISHCPDLVAHQTHALLASWNGNTINTDPVFIAAAIVEYMAANKIHNYFLNQKISK